MALRLGEAELSHTEFGKSDAQAPGSFMTLTAAPRPEGGSSVHGVWEQTSTNLAGLIGVATMRFIGPRFLSSYYKRVYNGLAS